MLATDCKETSWAGVWMSLAFLLPGIARLAQYSQFVPSHLRKSPQRNITSHNSHFGFLCSEYFPHYFSQCQQYLTQPCKLLVHNIGVLFCFLYLVQQPSPVMLETSGIKGTTVRHLFLFTWRNLSLTSFLRVT